jgi:RND family efflux transporter MFP subunit
MKSINPAAKGNGYSMRTRLILIGMLAGLMVTSACSPAKEEKTSVQKPRSVNIVAIERRDLPIVVNAVGRLVPNREVILSSQVSGIVQAYSVDTGDAATAGDMVVTLDPTDYQLALNEASANLLSAKARYTAAKKSYARAGKLLPEKVITPEFYDKIEAEYKATQAAVSQVEAMVDINRRRLEKTVIKAPFDGFVVRRLVEIGQNVDVGDPLIALADMHTMRVKIHVNEQDYVYLDGNDTVTVRVEAYPQRPFAGQVDRIGVKADAQTNTFEVEILVANPEMILKAGLTAAVGITVDEIRNAIMIPQDCVLFREKRQEVFVVTEGNRALAREVTLGRADGAFVRVLEGITAGEKLVTTGSQYLKDGDKVVVVDDT